MGSTRLPGKVLMDIGGATALCRVLHRLGQSSRLDEIVVATTETEQDDEVVKLCEQLGVAHFRGSEPDVLDRYLCAAHQFGADVVVRITADCPLIDAELVDDVIHVFLHENADFACNVLPRTYPRGLDTEVFTIQALERAWRECRQPYQREHVTPWFYERPDVFRTASLRGEQDYSRYRWTLDTREDLEFIRTIYCHFEHDDNFNWREVIALQERFPELAEINAHITQKAFQPSASML
jgi:spore coat polysaccharide biosynthesis protein SpsF